MNACDDVIAALAPYAECSLDGDVARVRTHCLYPSFEPVFVTVDRTGAGSYVVSDTGAAYAVAWDAGRDHRTIERAILQSASRFDVGTQGASILVTVPSLDWLASAIVAVANASSNAATEEFATLGLPQRRSLRKE